MLFSSTLCFSDFQKFSGLACSSSLGRGAPASQGVPPAVSQIPFAALPEALCYSKQQRRAQKSKAQRGEFPSSK
jgi:hypothetical protein